MMKLKHGPMAVRRVSTTTHLGGQPIPELSRAERIARTIKTYRTDIGLAVLVVLFCAMVGYDIWTGGQPWAPRS